jgi:hypothetical protein
MPKSPGLERPRAAAGEPGPLPDQIRGLRDGDLTSLDEADRALVTLAQAVETCTVTDERWDAASLFLSPHALAHVVLLASYYAMLCRIQFAYDVPLDEGLVGMAYPDAENTLAGV